MEKLKYMKNFKNALETYREENEIIDLPKLDKYMNMQLI